MFICSKCGTQNEANTSPCACCGTLKPFDSPPIAPSETRSIWSVLAALAIGMTFLLLILGINPISKIQDYYHYFGGLELTISVELDQAVKNRLKQVREELQKSLQKGSIQYAELTTQNPPGILITLTRKEDEKAFRDLIMSEYHDFELQSDNPETNKQGTHFKLLLKETVRHRILAETYSQVHSILWGRVESLNAKRFSVQFLKGLRYRIRISRFIDPQKIKVIICRPAVLELKLVGYKNMTGSDWKNNIPSDDQILYQGNYFDLSETSQRTPYLIQKQSILSNPLFKNVLATPSGVSVVLGVAEIEKLKNQTKIGDYLAVVMDNEIITILPIDKDIQAGQILLRAHYTPEEIIILAYMLWEGALPVPVKITDQRLIDFSPKNLIQLLRQH